MTRKRSKRAVAGAAPQRPPPPKPVVVPASGPGGFFAGFTVSAAKLSLFRVVFFACIGLDAFLQISHAPRYGAGGFNVSQLPVLDAILPVPTREGMLIFHLLQAYLAFLVVCGVGTRWAVKLIAALYGYTYFISQLDSYQHHYLVFLLLLLACFVPWEKRETPVPSWALRLMLLQVSIVYFWAAMAKMAPAWTDGTTLSKQLSVPWVRDLVTSLPGEFATAAQLVLLVELALAVLLCFRRTWLIALALGVGLHLGIELAGFRIGIFSYFMFALYTLLVPDRVLVPVAETLGAGLASTRRALERFAARDTAFAAVAAASLAGGALALVVLPFDESVIVAVVAALLAAVEIALHLRQRRRGPALRTAAAHLVAAATLFALAGQTDQAFDYYKFWGGSARRLADDADAYDAYTGLTRVSPDYAQGHYWLGVYRKKRGETSDALASFRRAQEATPPDPRAFTAEAELHDEAGDGPAAIAAAQKALGLDPSDRSARAILARWRSQNQPP